MVWAFRGPALASGVQSADSDTENEDVRTIVNDVETLCSKFMHAQDPYPPPKHSMAFLFGSNSERGSGGLVCVPLCCNLQTHVEFYNSTDGVYPTPSLSEVFDNTAILFLTLSSYVR